MGDPRDYYAYVLKGGTINSFKASTYEDFLKNSKEPYEEVNLPLSSSITIYNFPETTEYTKDKLRLYALKNTLNYNSRYSQSYLFSSSLGDKSKQKLTLISIPSVFFGSKIEKGSVDLKINFNNVTVGRIQDIKYNGELIETSGSNTGSIAGVVLYEQGFILLTGSWIIADNFSWNSFASSSTDDIQTSSSYDIDYNGTNDIQTLTMMAHAPKGQLNFSNNPTYIKYGESLKYNFSSSVNGYYEPENVQIKNITKYPYDNFSGSLEKNTYITTIGIYDENKNLIAIAKTSKPIRKTENRDFTFKLKFDF